MNYHYHLLIFVFDEKLKLCDFVFPCCIPGLSFFNKTLFQQICLWEITFIHSWYNVRTLYVQCPLGSLAMIDIQTCYTLVKLFGDNKFPIKFVVGLFRKDETNQRSGLHCRDVQLSHHRATVASKHGKRQTL